MSKQIVKAGAANSILSLEDDYLTPDAVKDGSGIEALGRDDFKIPRIVLLQGQSPELATYPEAKKDEFWHTGMNINLGAEFLFTPIVVNRRVILFRPRNDGGGILAFSKNGTLWDSGANQTFQVKLKGRKEPVAWSTGSNVLNSRLLQFGSSNPDDPKSAPAATLIYEYLVYLPDYPELSPCVFSAAKTATKNAKDFNMALGMAVSGGKPITCLVVRAFTETLHNDEGTWTVPEFKLEGRATKEVYEIASSIAKSNKDYKVEYNQSDVETETLVDDAIQF
jgi:hypothetical protein